MTLAQWFSFNGRISRKTWWIFYFLIPIGINIAASALDAQFFGARNALPDKSGMGDVGMGPFSMIAALGGLWIGLAGQAKLLEGFQGLNCHWARAGIVDLLVNVLGQQGLGLGAGLEPGPCGPVEIGHMASPVEEHHAVLQGIEQWHVDAQFHAAAPRPWRALWGAGLGSVVTMGWSLSCVFN